MARVAGLVVGVVILLAITGGEAKVKLKKNKYTGLVIAINPEVPENPALIESIKTAFKSASSDLYRATKNRAYFGKIRILVPITWTNGSYNASDGEKYKKADILVAYENPQYGEVPYTLQYGMCGEPGTYIHLTPNYLLDDTFVFNYGPRGKTIIHEWAHYRWGVFDETVTNGYDPFYLSYAGKPEANRCPISVRGNNYYVDWNQGTYRECSIDPQTYLPEEGCQFVPDPNISPDPAASMLSYQYLDSVYTFCGDDATDTVNLHNKEAPNEHNRICSLRSTWDVISSSADFFENNNPTNNEITDIEPDFEVVQPQSYQRFVLVLDVSGSMEGTRLLMMRQAASIFIMQAAPQDSEIGIVQFSSSALTLSYMTKINDYSDRVDLNALLPTVANGGTSIGSGVQKGIDVLQQGGKSSEGGILIVLSDGLENTAPTLSDVYNEIISSGVVVNSIVFTLNADPMLQTIATDTGGIWYFSDEDTINSTTTALTDAFVNLAQVDDGDVYRENFQIYSSSFTVKELEQESGRIVVDQTIGNNTVFTFTWSQYIIPVQVILMAPSGCNFASFNVEDECISNYEPITDTDLKTIQFPIPGKAETGTWTYFVNTGTNYSQNVVVTATSMASNRDIPPIVVESGMGNVAAADGDAIVVYAQVSMGYAPVLKADVQARIERPSGGPVTIKLKDKGAAPDVRKNDGVYSRYFTNYNGPGKYSVQVTVTGVEGQTQTVYSTGSKAAFNVGTIDSEGNLVLNPGGGPPTVSEGTDTGEFARYSSAGGFDFTGSAAPGNDTFPPSKIIDLGAKQSDVGDMNSGVKIDFTAPGDDFDEGTASSYEIRCTYGSPSNLITDFTSNVLVPPENMRSGNISQPKVSGSDETFTFVLPNPPQYGDAITVGVAIRARDEAGNTGDVSNIVTVNYFIEPPVIEQGNDDNTDFIVMIVFICTTCILLLVVAGLFWKLNQMKKIADKGDTPLSSVYENPDTVRRNKHIA